MVYTKKHPALLVMGVLFVAIAYMTESGMMGGLIDFLKASKYSGEMVAMGYAFGGLGVIVGAWHMWGKHEEGSTDYYLSSIAGAMFILLVAMAVRWYLAPWIVVLSKSLGPIMGAKYLHQVLGLNYIVLGILAGIFIVNGPGIPAWAENGVRLSRLGLKTGVILLGTLYSLAELQSLGKLSAIMVGFFVLGSVAMVLWLGKRHNIPSSMGGVLSAGMGVCGVSATVAAAPVVQAKAVEIAYTIGTILIWGVGCMFIFPVVGHLLGLGHIQFGAWAGTGILNSAQVAGAALAYQPDGIETLKVAEIFNITRVLFLPIIVLWLAVWYIKRGDGDVTQQVNVGRVIFEKFPVFVLGFILMFALSSTGVFAPAQHYKGKYFDNTISESKMLTDEQLATLGGDAASLQREDRQAALASLMENRKFMSIDDETVIRGIFNADVLSKGSNKILKAATKAVRHTAAKIKKFRQWITLLFAFGLTGLGMQITFSAMKQAGGQPLVIGGIVGTVKAVLSLIVIIMFVKETI